MRSIRPDNWYHFHICWVPGGFPWIAWSPCNYINRRCHSAPRSWRGQRNNEDNNDEMAADLLCAVRSRPIIFFTKFASMESCNCVPYLLPRYIILQASTFVLSVGIADNTKNIKFPRTISIAGSRQNLSEKVIWRKRSENNNGVVRTNDKLVMIFKWL